MDWVYATIFCGVHENENKQFNTAIILCECICNIFYASFSHLIFFSISKFKQF